MNKSSKMPNAKKVIIKPIIISGINNRNMVLAPHRITPNLILSNLKVAKGPIYQEDVIYESSNCDFLKGESQQVLIVNKVNIATKTCRTIAKCTSKGVCVETTSDDVCALIGQNNYDTVLSALGSLFNQETKVRGILALLKPQTKHRTTATQTDIDIKSIKRECIDSSSQTLESNIEVAGKLKQRKRIRRHPFTPYVVKEEKEVKKCVINIDNICKKEELKKEINNEQEENLTELPDIKAFVDEDSNFSCGSIGNMSSLSSAFMPDFLSQCNIEADTQSSINKVTCSLIKVYDGTSIMVPVKPEDEFHIATPEILKNVTREERIKLLCHQAFIDFKMCLQQNEDGY
ncbi:hypothetical protein MSG28_015346 [Choristoneura fumiferana]|uniref:Uncharacterized protein n=2 Tax=Choristoneura fumiferana TaxID=7141 RepID=A0ACC0KAJ2_CHOFU|nr:hypothetical protein MSG28_015346 [Choristoneura fumiferana]